MSESSLSDEHHDLHSLTQDATAVGLFHDGNVDNDAPQYHSDEEITECADIQDRNREIYLSIFDPIGDEAFRPSKTKPLPKWMSFLPSNVDGERQQQPSGPLRNTSADPSAAKLPEHGATSTDPVAVSEDQAFSGSASALSPVDTAEAFFKAPGRSIKVTTASEPIREYVHGEIVQSAKKAQALDVISSSFPLQFQLHDLGRRTPFLETGAPQRGTERIYYKEPASYPADTTSYISELDQGRLFGPGVQAAAHIIKRTDTVVERVHPSVITPHSSVYLPKYNLEADGSRDDSSGDRKYKANTAGPILEKIKRQRVGKLSMAHTTEQKKSDGSWRFKTRDEKHTYDHGRGDLQRELRRLFSEA